MEERFTGGACRATPPTPASIGSSVLTAMKKVRKSSLVAYTITESDPANCGLAKLGVTWLSGECYSQVGLGVAKVGCGFAKCGVVCSS